MHDGFYYLCIVILSFYYATIAYHVGLIAVLGWPQGIMANVYDDVMSRQHVLRDACFLQYVYQ